MAHISSFKYIVMAGCLISSINAYAWKTLVGNDSSRIDQTFSFGIKAHCAQAANKIVLVGAEHSNEGKEYSLSKISLHDYKISSCASELVTLDGVYDKPNPLYNAAISYIVCASSTYAAVYNPANKSMLYGTNYFGADGDLISAQIKDMNGESVRSIVNLATNGQGLIFAAIQNAGTDQYGIATLSYSEKTEKKEITDEEFKKLEKEAIEAKDDVKKIQRLKKGLEIGQDGKPCRTVTTRALLQDQVAFGLPAYVKEVTALSWHPGVGCLYVGASYIVPIEKQRCGILIGRLQKDNSMTFERIDNLDLFRNGSIDEIVPFTTTTGSLDYILIKNSAAPAHIYSLGVCNQRLLDLRETFTGLGAIADVTQKPQDIYESQRNRFLGRQFAKPFEPNKDASLCITHNVGCGYLHAGSIRQLSAVGDVVFATVTQPVHGHSGGVYQSQALYDCQGRISGWTLWQKALEHEGVDFALLNNAKSSMMIFGQDNESEKGTRTVQVNKWPEVATDEIAQLIESAQKEFVENKLEIKKIIDFSILTPGVPYKNLTVLISSSKLLIVQMPDFASTAFEQNSLQAVGTLTCAQVGISDKYGWLFIGGTHGLAKMVDVDGNGWDMPQGLQHVDRLQGMYAQPVGNYTMVRKILFDQGFLYVLTDTQFDRIDLETNEIISLATTEQLCNQRYAIFYDALVSDKCALLATSAGLYRVGNKKNIMHDNAFNLNWTQLKVPEATDLSLFLLPVSNSGNPHDWAKGSGQVYIITGSYTKKGAHVHRFAVEDVANHDITDTTIAPVPDLVFMDRISDIGSLLICSDCFSTDGLFYLAPFQQKKSKPMQLYNGLTRSRTPINLELKIEDTITCITRNSTHGNWLVAGSFGLKTNI